MSNLFKDKFVVYEMQRDGKCRGCNKKLTKGTSVCATYTTHGKGSYIFICENCVDDIIEMKDEIRKENQK